MFYEISSDNRDNLCKCKVLYLIKNQSKACEKVMDNKNLSSWYTRYRQETLEVDSRFVEYSEMNCLAYENWDFKMKRDFSCRLYYGVILPKI